MQVKKEKLVKMSFKDYYKSLSELQLDLRSKVMERFGISEKTFYNKMNEESWSPAELDEIQKIQADLTRIITELC